MSKSEKMHKKTEHHPGIWYTVYTNQQNTKKAQWYDVKGVSEKN